MNETNNINTSEDRSEKNLEHVEIFSEIKEVKKELSYLRELFIRRLQVDKQKQELINSLENKVDSLYLKPFIYDIILLLDRLNNVNDEFVNSIYDELYDIINIRGVEIIDTKRGFDSNFHKIVDTTKNEDVSEIQIYDVVRNGYMINNNVIRPTEVRVFIPNNK